MLEFAIGLAVVPMLIAILIAVGNERDEDIAAKKEMGKNLARLANAIEKENK